MQLYLRNVDRLFFKISARIDEDGYFSVIAIPMRGIVIDQELYRNTLIDVFSKSNGGVEPRQSQITDAAYEITTELNRRFSKLMDEGQLEVFDIDSDLDKVFYGSWTSRFTSDGMISNSPYATLRDPTPVEPHSIH